MQYISLFESLTGAKVKDCILNEEILFIISENDMGLAIGKHGSNLKRAEQAFKKKIKVIEFSSDIRQFIQNVIYPAKAKEIRQEEDTVTISTSDAKSKGAIYGRERSRLEFIKGIVSRYFDINEIKVI
jgi:transcription termination/antitermination protein NusA